MKTKSLFVMTLTILTLNNAKADCGNFAGSYTSTTDSHTLKIKQVGCEQILVLAGSTDMNMDLLIDSKYSGPMYDPATTEGSHYTAFINGNIFGTYSVQYNLKESTSLNSSDLFLLDSDGNITEISSFISSKYANSDVSTITKWSKQK